MTQHINTTKWFEGEVLRWYIPEGVVLEFSANEDCSSPCHVATSSGRLSFFGASDCAGSPNSDFHICGRSDTLTSAAIVFQQGKEILPEQSVDIQMGQSGAAMLFYQPGLQLSASSASEFKLSLMLFSFTGTVQQYELITQTTVANTFTEQLNDLLGHGWLYLAIENTAQVTVLFEKVLATDINQQQELYNYSEVVHTWSLSVDAGVTVLSATAAIGLDVQMLSYSVEFDYSVNTEKTLNALSVYKSNSLSTEGTLLVRGRFKNAPPYYASVPSKVQFYYILDGSLTALVDGQSYSVQKSTPLCLVWDVDAGQSYFQVQIEASQMLIGLLSKDFYSGQSFQYVETTAGVGVINQRSAGGRYFLNLSSEADAITTAKLSVQQYILVEQTNTPVQFVDGSAFLLTTQHSLCVHMPEGSLASLTDSQTYQHQDKTVFCSQDVSGKVLELKLTGVTTLSGVTAVSGREDFWTVVISASAFSKQAATTFKTFTYKLSGFALGKMAISISFDSVQTLTALQVIGADGTVYWTDSLVGASSGMYFLATGSAGEQLYLSVSGTSQLGAFQIRAVEAVGPEDFGLLKTAVGVSREVALQPDSFAYLVDFNVSVRRRVCATTFLNADACQNSSARVFMVAPVPSTDVVLAVITANVTYSAGAALHLSAAQPGAAVQRDRVYIVDVSTTAGGLVHVRAEGVADLCLLESLESSESAGASGCVSEVLGGSEVAAWVGAGPRELYLRVSGIRRRILSLRVVVAEQLGAWEAAVYSQAWSERVFASAVAPLSGGSRAFVVATPAASSGPFVLQVSGEIGFFAVEFSDASPGIKVVPYGAYIRAVCKSSNCEYTLGVRQALLGTTEGLTPELAPGELAQLALHTARHARLELCMATPNGTIQLGPHSWEVAEGGARTVFAQNNEAETQIWNLGGPALQARIYNDDPIQEWEPTGIEVQQSKGYVTITYTETPAAPGAIFRLSQLSKETPSVYVYNEAGLSPEDIPDTLCGVQRIGTAVQAEVTRDGDRAQVRFYYPKLTNKNRIMLTGLTQAFTSPLQYTGVITGPNDSDQKMIATAVCLSIGAAILLVVMCCVDKKGSQSKKKALRFPTGTALVDATCGWSLVLVGSSFIVAVLATIYYTWHLNALLNRQKVGFTGLSVDSVTAFIFTASQPDAFVHSVDNQNSAVSVQFTENVLDIKLGSFGTAGQASFMKAFVKLSGKQLGLVGETLEYSVDFTTNQRHSLVCQVTPVGGQAWAARPEVKLQEIDVQEYRGASYFTNQGALTQDCAWDSSPSTQNSLRVRYDPVAGALISTPTNVVLRVLLLGIFAVFLCISIFICFKRTLGNTLVLRRYPEHDRFNTW